MKKLLFLFTTILLPMIASADESGTCGDNLTWTYVDSTKTLTISGSGNLNYQDYPWHRNTFRDNIAIVVIENGVTSIGQIAFSGCSGLTSVTIPNSVTSIGNDAFYGCTRLPSVTIPNSVTSIGERAFHGCSSLTSVTIPNSVTSIGDRAFSNCSGLTSVHITDLESWCNISFKNSESNPLTYAHHLFLNGEEIKDLIIPSNVTSIGNEAFHGCSSLTSVKIHNCVTSIGRDAFSGCSSLSSVTIPNSVTSIGDGAFSGCSSLTSVKIPNSVTIIGSGAFSGCSGLTSVTIGNSVTSIGSGAFEKCSGLTSVTIPNSVTYIGHSAFYWCSSLTSVTIPNSVTSIGDYAFDGCSSLTSVTIPNGVTSIGSQMFDYCSSLTSVTIGNSVTSIGYRTFYSCKLENIFTKNSKTAFKESAFSDRTFRHAMVYIPEGTWSDAVYEGSWYLFNNIRETTVEAGKLSASRAYMLMDTNTFGYAVYDDASNEVKMAKAFYSIDEQDLNNCWQVKTQDGQKYLYNLGAKEYASVSADGRLTLSAVPSAVRLTETDNGITLGSDASHQWAFVKNGSQPDMTGIEAPAVSHDEEAVSYYSLGGQQLAQPRKGLVIKKTADGKSRKVMVR